MECHECKREMDGTRYASVCLMTEGPDASDHSDFNLQWERTYCLCCWESPIQGTLAAALSQGEYLDVCEKRVIDAKPQTTMREIKAARRNPDHAGEFKTFTERMEGMTGEEGTPMNKAKWIMAIITDTKTKEQRDEILASLAMVLVQRRTNN